MFLLSLSKIKLREPGTLKQIQIKHIFYYLVENLFLTPFATASYIFFKLFVLRNVSLCCRNKVKIALLILMHRFVMTALCDTILNADGARRGRPHRTGTIYHLRRYFSCPVLFLSRILEYYVLHCSSKRYSI